MHITLSFKSLPNFFAERTMEKITFLCSLLVPILAQSSITHNIEVMQSSCLMACVQPLKDMTIEIDFTEVASYGTEASRLDPLCESMRSAAQCADKCIDIPFNPFRMRIIQAVCGRKQQQELKSHAACYKRGYAAVSEKCEQQCSVSIGDLGSRLASVAAFTQPLPSSSGAAQSTFDLSDIDTLLKALATTCQKSKCQARCHRDEFTRVCADTDASAGGYLQEYSEGVLRAMNDDMATLQFGSLMQLVLPQECAFILHPDLLFDDVIQHPQHLHLSQTSQTSSRQIRQVVPGRKKKLLELLLSSSR